MEKALLILLLFFTAVNVHSQDWTTLPNSPTSTTLNGHEDIWFINVNTGWICGGNGIWKTTNGGNNWLQQYTSEIHNISFADSLNGWATATGGVSFPSIYKTTNGGTNWTGLTNIPSPGVAGLMGLSVYDANVINASGYDNGTPRFIRTTNGGANWICKDLSAYVYAAVDCHFYSRDSGFVVGQTTFSLSSNNRGVILWTGDGGNTWSVRFTSTTRVSAGWRFSFPTANTGYATFNSITNGTPSIFAKTTNRGVTWSQVVYTPAPNYFYDIKGIGFITAQTGWVGRQESQYVFETTNGGATWHEVVFGANVNRLRFVTDSIGYAAGTRVYKFARTWLVPVKHEDGAIPSSFKLHQNFPNPFNPSTRISYDVPLNANIKIILYDVKGRMLKELVNRHHTRGSYSIEFDGSTLASGIYFYKLVSDNISLSNKMTLLK